MSEEALAGEASEATAGDVRDWRRDGTWKRVLTGLRVRADAAGLITWEVSVDSTVARAHQHAAGASKKGLRSGSPRVVLTPNRRIMGSGSPGVD
ncbi:hypothetical protein [Frankia sp. AiPa1]|uniref:hypothetical protein n=1 Tax=Frankia sp. AiPa1 TaxID=573492 RepID=UPI00202B3286|nr:hypothetical protein [Frankia sp. AiPa1]MCL9760929.1 hypothetical protein [Frankia sp. AiPa1]